MGLTEKEAAERLRKNGENRLAEGKKTGALSIFLSQFRDVMVLILLAATVISAILGEITDAVTIILIVLLNAVLGFVQEFRTEKTLEALKSMTAPTAKCLRDGKMTVIPAKNLVTEDVIELESGDRVPADCVLLRSAGLFTDESMLTGESESVEKSVGSTSDFDNSLNKSNIIYCGTSVTKGSAAAMVIATGISTQMGQISTMLDEIDRKPTPLQIRLAELGKIVAIICIAVCIAVFCAGVLRGEEIFTMLMTGITIAIAAIPEGLPATVTIALALAVNRMMKQKALANKLHSVETLGCTSVICSDKTGTITENKMTVTEIFSDDTIYNVSGLGYRCEGKITSESSSIAINANSNAALGELLRCGVICNNADISQKSHGRFKTRSDNEWLISGDPTEAALLICAAKTDMTKQKISEIFRRKSELPFDSETRYMAVLTTSPTGEKCWYKGAPEVILPMCSDYLSADGQALNLTPDKRKKINSQILRMSDNALRVLALAYCQTDDVKNIEKLTFLGLVGMIDPPREEAKIAIKKCAAASVKTVMITGDHKNTAVAVAKKARLLKGKLAMTGAELDKLSDSDLDKIISNYSVFARVEPYHKLRIVKSFRRRGEVVTMTGDGVNDAPAIKEADVGVAMGVTGTDVTKQAADVILLDDNFGTLVNAVEQGRCVYANIRRFVRYLLSCNIGEVLTMFLGILMGMPIILLPVQLLLVNLVTDGLPAIALGMEPPEPNLMCKPPRKSTEGFFANGLMTKIIFRGIFIAMSSLASFSIVLHYGGTIGQGRTSALITLVVSQLIHVFECKSEDKSLFSINLFSNMKLVFAVLFSAAVLAMAVAIPQFQVIFQTVPLLPNQLLTALGLSVAVPVMCGIFKS